MKKSFLNFLMLILLASCGGSGIGTSDSADLPKRILYGFDVAGKLYAGQVNPEQNHYSYSQIDPRNLASVSTEISSFHTVVAINAKREQPGVYAISGHGDHALASDVDKTLLLASTISGSNTFASPAAFVTQPLVSYADIAGTYYFSKKTYWLKITISARGEIVLGCDSFTEQSTDGLGLSFNQCDGISPTSANLTRLSKEPFWSLTFRLNFTDLGGEIQYEENRTALFVKNSTGRTLLLGEGNARSNFGGNISDTSINQFHALQDSVGLKPPTTWTGDWVFNRLGGDNSFFNLSASGVGRISNGSTFTSSTLQNLTDTLTPLFDISLTSKTVSENEQIPGASRSEFSLSRLAILTNSLAQEISNNFRLNNTALFKKITPIRKISYLAGNNTSGPYYVPLELGDESIDAPEVWLATGQDGIEGINLTSKLQENVDFTFNFETLVFRNSIPSFDIQGRRVLVVINSKLKPNDSPSRMPSLGVRLR